jgi:hypothetical protein
MRTRTHSLGRFGNAHDVALGRWETEGGAIGAAGGERRDRQVPLSEQEALILQCLGAAVLSRWYGLPTHIQHDLFEHSFEAVAPRDAARLKKRIARFLHKHKDDARGAQ